MPGSKVIKAFNKGLSQLDDDYDVIVKLDSDLILPLNYFETILKHFKSVIRGDFDVFPTVIL